MLEEVPRRLAERLRNEGFYVSRHANWLVVMKDGRMAALVYIYPLHREAEIVDMGAGREIEEALLAIVPEFRVSVRKPLHERY